MRSSVSCYECEKPRCIYSKKALTAREERSLRRLLEKYQYTCGSVIVPDGKNIVLINISNAVKPKLQLCSSVLHSSMNKSDSLKV